VTHSKTFIRCWPMNRTIQGDKKASVHLSLSYYFAQSDCLAADRQGQGDTRLTLTPYTDTRLTLTPYTDTRLTLTSYTDTRLTLTPYIDTRLTLTPSAIPNSNYVIMVNDKLFKKYFCTVIIRCTETFLSPCINQQSFLCGCYHGTREIFVLLGCYTTQTGSY
jgi:hypothetical protein